MCFLFCSSFFQWQSNDRIFWLNPKLSPIEQKPNFFGFTQTQKDALSIHLNVRYTYTYSIDFLSACKRIGYPKKEPFLKRSKKESKKLNRCWAFIKQHFSRPGSKASHVKSKQRKKSVFCILKTVTEYWNCHMNHSVQQKKGTRTFEKHFEKKCFGRNGKNRKLNVNSKKTRIKHRKYGI